MCERTRLYRTSLEHFATACANFSIGLVRPAMVGIVLAYAKFDVALRTSDCVTCDRLMREDPCRSLAGLSLLRPAHGFISTSPDSKMLDARCNMSIMSSPSLRGLVVREAMPDSGKRILRQKQRAAIVPPTRARL